MPVHYTWSFPGAPVDVRLSLDVVRRLREELDGSGEPVSKQGLLLGRIAGHTTEIQGFKVLTEPASAVAVGDQPPGTEALVGYFQTTSDAALKLSNEDVHLAETLLPNPRQVFLLLHPDPAGTPSATFFFWDEGRICGDFPFLEFPFDDALLAFAEQQRIENLPQKRSAAMTEPAQESMEEPVRVPAPLQMRRVWKPVWWGLVALMVFGVAGALTAVKLFPEKFGLAKPSERSGLPSMAVTALGLRAERQNGDLTITWDRQSPAILSAVSGALSIEDAGVKRSLTLGPAQVRSGNILYAPLSEQVQIELTVFGTQGSTSESAIVIVPRGGAPEVRTLARKMTANVPGQEGFPNQQSEVSGPPRQLRQFTAPSAVAAPSMTIEEPPALAARPERPLPLPSGVVGSAFPVAASTAASEKAAAPKPQSISPAQSAYLPPTVARRVIPAFPPALRQVLTKKKVVDVKVALDANGKVLKAQALPTKEWTPELMLATAVNAVRMWKFIPAQLGGRPVPVEIVVQFEFKPPE